MNLLQKKCYMTDVYDESCYRNYAKRNYKYFTSAFPVTRFSKNNKLKDVYATLLLCSLL